MEWFIIFLALGVAIGPMLYLMPTDRDRHIAGLRALAKKMGYTVQLDKVLKLDAEASRAYRGSTIFTTYRNLSASVNCFDWKTESRGDQKDAWMLRWW